MAMRSVRACAALLAAASAATVPASSRSVVWQGRTVTGDAAFPAGAVAFSWEGVQASFTVTGTTTVSMLAGSTLPGPARFHVLVDGAIVTNVTSPAHSPASTTTLASGLDASTAHNLTLWYITDPISISWPLIPDGGQASAAR